MTEVNMASAKKAAEAVRAARDQLSASKSALESERDALKARSEFLLSLPVTREDAKQVILDSIDTIGAEFPELASWQAKFHDYAYPQGAGRKENPGAPLTMRDVEQMSRGDPERTRVLGTDHLGFYAAPMADWAPSRIYFFFGDLIKAKISEHFDQVFPHFHERHADQQLTLGQRRVEISANDARIATINAEIAAIERQLREIQP